MVKNLPANAGDAKDVRSVPGWGRFPWSRKEQPALVFLPGNSTDRGAWWATVHGATKSQTEQLSICACVRARTHTHTHTHTPNVITF